MAQRDPLFDVSGRSVIVAGAGGGLGGAIAAELYSRGAQLLLFDIDEARLEAVAAALPGAEAVVANICDESALESLTKAAVRRFGKLDAAVNAAGVLPINSALDMDYDAFRDCIEVNLSGAFLFSRSIARAMQSAGGRILHLASVSSQVSNDQYAAYSSSKAGLTQLVRVLGREWADRGITVNAIGPALVETPLTRKYLADEAFSQRAIAAIPMGRLARPGDLLGAVILLLSPAGAFITGQTIYVDGGRTLV
jgi:NAD(P)-dependent dehydrogenase (short-subunit alcohol dehydrogenase family)